MLVLEYDLILPVPAKLPPLGDVYREKGKLRDIIARWNNAVTRESTTQDDNFPTLLAHVCDNIYSSEPLSFDVLEGNDRFRATYLRDLCAALHIGLYIANLDRTLTGFCEDFCNDDDYCMTVEDEDSIVLTNIVDLDGNTVGSDLSLEVDDNFVASDPFDDDPDKEDFDRNHGLVTYYYQRTVSIGPGLAPTYANLLQVLVMIPSVAKAEWLADESQEERPKKRKRSVGDTDQE